MTSVPLILLNLIFVFVGVLSNTKSIFVPCKKSDEICMKNSINTALSLLADGIPSLNIEPIEPLQISDAKGEISNLKYKFKNFVGNNYSKCTISNVKLNLEDNTLFIDLYCPNIILEGYVQVSGEMLNLPVEGDGPIQVISGKYLIKIEAINENVKGTDGQMHMALKLSNIIGEALEPVKIDYNLITKDKLTPEAAIKFEQEKLNKLLETLISPFLKNVFNDLFNIVNKYLKSIPINDLFID